MEEKRSHNRNASGIRSVLLEKYWSAKNGLGLLAIMGITLGLVASSSELWLSNESSLFARFTSFEHSVFYVIITGIILFILYYYDWKRTVTQKSLLRNAFYSLACALLDLFQMWLVIMFSFLLLNELTLSNFHLYWKLFYLTMPLTIGEFALSSALTNLLQKAKNLERRSHEHEQKIVETAKSLQDVVVPPAPDIKEDSERLQDYLSKKKRGERSIGNRTEEK